MELESLKTQFDVLGWLMINMLKAKGTRTLFFSNEFISPAFGKHLEHIRNESNS
jgi:hypothetical protein